MKRVVGVIGGSKVNEKNYRAAYQVGRFIGERGYVLLNGGLGGVMEASAKGANKAGGLVIGILPGGSKSSANDWIDIPIVTGLSHARNVIIAKTADILVAINGSVGTQSEIAFSHIYKKKIIGLNCKIPLPFEKVDSPEEAIKLVDSYFKKGKLF